MRESRAGPAPASPSSTAAGPSSGRRRASSRSSPPSGCRVTRSSPGLAAAGAEVVHRQHRPGRQAQVGVDPPAEGEGEPVAGRAHPALLVDAGLEAEEVPGHGEVAAVVVLPAALLPGRARPGVAQGRGGSPLRAARAAAGPPGPPAARRETVIRPTASPLRMRVTSCGGDPGDGYGDPAEGQRDVPRRGEEELQLRLRPVAPDEGAPAVRPRPAPTPCAAAAGPRGCPGPPRPGSRWISARSRSAIRSRTVPPGRSGARPCRTRPGGRAGRPGGRSPGTRNGDAMRGLRIGGEVRLVNRVLPVDSGDPGEV